MKSNVLTGILTALLLLIRPSFSAPIEILHWNFDDVPFVYPDLQVDASHSGLIQASGYAGMGITDVRFGGRMMWGGGGAMHFDLVGLPAHNVLDVNFLLAVMNSWDGQPPNGCCNPDYLNVSIQNLDAPGDIQLAFSHSFNNVFGFVPGFPGPDAQGYSRTLGNQIVAPTKNLIGDERWFDAAYDMYLDQELSVISNDWQNIRIMIHASGEGWQGSLDESFAIDQLNVKLDTVVPPIPEPSSMVLLAFGTFLFRISTRFKVKMKKVYTSTTPHSS